MLDTRKTQSKFRVVLAASLLRRSIAALEIGQAAFGCENICCDCSHSLISSLLLCSYSMQLPPSCVGPDERQCPVVNRDRCGSRKGWIHLPI
ncbi:hypothetical protein QBC45DRAFT_172470 [Copromyces sp. CBS 386.78]|nr:hypothetical protein QBC45DRAFT_172470 [Copromyces sp. CBS 386.78]